MSKEFGVRLAALRKLTGLNQQDFQKECGWGDGTKNSRISMYETGNNEPTLADIEVMAAILKVSPAHLAYGTPDTLSPAELKLVGIYRRTNDQGRSTLNTVAESQPTYPSMDAPKNKTVPKPRGGRSETEGHPNPEGAL